MLDFERGVAEKFVSGLEFLLTERCKVLADLVRKGERPSVVRTSTKIKQPELL